MASLLLEKALQILPIEPSYFDIWGTRQEVTEERIRGILKALRFSIDHEESCCRELEEWKRQMDERALPAALVVREGGRRVLLTGFEGARWVLTLEDGAERTGIVSGEVLHVPEDVPLGYHMLRVSRGGKEFSSELILVPDRAYLGTLEKERMFGLSVQLYSLRSAQSEGIGDFRDLKTLQSWVSQCGGAFVGVNPLHALFPSDPRGYSPYSPSSRRALNPLFIRVSELPEVTDVSPAPDVRTPFVDYGAVAEWKMKSLLSGWRSLLAGESSRKEEYLSFLVESDEHTKTFALHAALDARHRALGEWDWQKRYPTPDLIPDERLREERDFQLYLQWVARSQLSGARNRGELGLYLDLAVGVNPTGAEVWEDPELFAVQASSGAPPDLLNVLGQVWGLAPYIPWELEDRAYRPFRETLRFNMQFGGALRVDHIMALQRLFWVPEGMTGRDGVYLRYRLHDLLGIVCLESVRNRCVVIGEDLGTVPNEIREEMAKRDVLSYKVLYFMKRYDGDGSFLAQDEYPERALVATSTHDLPTLRGFLEGRDLEVRKPLGLFSESCTYEGETQSRRLDVKRLLERLGLPADTPYSVILDRVNEFLAATPAALQVVQLEDLLGESEQMNLPGTVQEHPNWRRRVSASLEELVENPLLQRMLQAIFRLRGERGEV